MSVLPALRRFLPGTGKAAVPSLQRYETHVEDMGFHPADIEILDTPPSPVRMSMIISICALATAVLVWSFVGTIDIVAVAQGKFKPVGDTKIIQPLEGGKVAAINVENGQHVKAGDILVELDPGDARADETDAATTLASSRSRPTPSSSGTPISPTATGPVKSKSSAAISGNSLPRLRPSTPRSRRRKPIATSSRRPSNRNRR
jgi:hemolysin D